MRAPASTDALIAMQRSAVIDIGLQIRLEREVDRNHAVIERRSRPAEFVDTTPPRSFAGSTNQAIGDRF